MPEITSYNPLDKDNLAESIASKLMAKNSQPLSSCSSERGAGIYAIYYDGDFALYRELVEGKPEKPIYVGKAIPAEGRKGGQLFDATKGNELGKRLGEHLKSISQAENLDPNDFSYRSLVVEDIWIPLGETIMIQTYRPLWNLVVDGFGNHTPGSGRSNQAKSSWDVIHPGRAWANSLTGIPKTFEQVKDAIDAYFSTGRIQFAVTEAIETEAEQLSE